MLLVSFDHKYIYMLEMLTGEALHIINDVITYYRKH